MPATGGMTPFGLDYDSQIQSPSLGREKSMNTGAESGSAEDEPMEGRKMIDDVYDVNSLKPQYILQSLRQNWVLNYMEVMQM